MSSQDLHTIDTYELALARMYGLGRRMLAPSPLAYACLAGLLLTWVCL